MTDSAESRRRGCPFINLSKEDVPPYACMMLVAPPDKRTKGNDAVNSLQWKSTGLRGFGFEVDNEYGVYIDKCDTLGMLLQDPYRFVFNTDITVPPGGTGYCSFGEFPARASLDREDLQFSNYWDGAFYGPIENEWHVQPLLTTGAYKFFGKSQANTRMVMIIPNLSLSKFYGIEGTYTCTGTSNAVLDPGDRQTLLGVNGSIFFSRLFGYPSNSGTFSTPITLKAPGVYVFAYNGRVDALNPDPSDTTIPYRFEVADDIALAVSSTQKRGEGVLTRVSSGYSTYWPSHSFTGYCRVLVGDNPVELQLKQVLSEKVEAQGEWWLSYDREASSHTFGYGGLIVGDPWWALWGLR